ncbi:unnamed protein product [Calicophoron daubneyi]|uniref:Small acidic protein n=1 Tax=Calicophoron daubneyi TaxID=300641 RepID=A0AAV2TSZ1_CALDB
MAARQPGGDGDVHSPNAWENADLGSEERNEKFLRLMGGGAGHKHKGAIVIGEATQDAHGIRPVDRDRIADQLESQYVEGIDRCTHFTRHAGLGVDSSPTNSFSSDTVAADKRDLKKQYYSGFVKAKDPSS